ncbi:ABC transporter, ATP-binding protein [Synechococcus sp. PCC 7335]|uniref:ABC transporter ATP-binding protein n=1 Tax=Synechococcus sp. (strain ATCC 29403 / PCC 7335) TaxID=91464 RepID=UPI00017ED978|nr:ABC transporter ATP-binding protein [Synechococcus sp. PCC 7335]EDX86641.1 ABC transporter, ATP-binding protein [Synechococcus sp. PCC 7335]
MTTLSTPPSSAPFVAASHPSHPPDLQVNGMTKQFGSLVALNNVSMHLKPGSFHALLGENGAGKSTLVKCIMGFYTPTAGKLLIDGKPIQIDNPRAAHRYRIGMVYQHFTSVPAMTVAENLVLSRFGNAGVINWKTEMEALRAFISTSPFQVPLDVPIAQLAAGQKQKLEILKQIYLNSRILILDEPTSVLTPAEADEVLGLLREQVNAGQLSILMISHKFREVMAFADEITVLRKGAFAGSGQVSELTIADMAEMMMGEKKEPTPVEKRDRIEAAPVLEVRQLGANKDSGLTAFSDINLTVYSGEIVGIAGISGNGQRELVEVLAGQRQATAGEVQVNGERYGATRAEMYQHQVFALPEEPLRNACVGHMSVAENMALRTFDRPPQAKGPLLSLRAIRQMAVGLISQFSVKTPAPETPVQNLSGGNVQRAVLARELSTPHIKLLIAANPCFGLDFAAVDFIHTQIIDARNRGVAVLLVSEDLDELLKLSDRLIVISGGQFSYQSPIASADYAAIGHAMAGH